MIVLLFQSARSSVVDTTYLGIALNLSANGSPARDGQAAAKPSYVTRPRSIESTSASTSSLSLPVASLKYWPDQRWGSSATLSSVVKAVTMSFPTTSPWVG
jgi:hypothetical protein